MEKARENGYTFRAGALAYALGNGTFDVYCCTCSFPLGTFTSEILMRAIIRSLEKGGVRCPGCRKKTCQMCHVMEEPCKSLETVLYRIGEGKSEAIKVCSICRMELEEEPEAGVVTTEFSGNLSEFVAPYADADAHPGTPNPSPDTLAGKITDPSPRKKYVELKEEMDEIEKKFSWLGFFGTE